MPVSDEDIVWYLSSDGASEGGAKSATPITDNVDENYFEDISNTARIAGGEQIRKLFAANEDGVDAYPDHSIWCFFVPANCTPFIGLGADHANDNESDAGTLVEFSGNAKVALASDGPDTRTVRLRGKDGSGNPITEDVVLTGASEVLSIATFSSVYLAAATAVDGSRTITIRQGAAGTVRGQIPIGFLTCFRWVEGATSKSLGLHLDALVTGSADPVWTKLEWDPDVSPASTKLALRAQTL